MRPSPVVFAALSLAGGCAAFDPDPALRRFADCDDMRTYMEKMAIDEARWQWQWQGLNLGTGGIATQDYDLSATDAGGASSYSTTNVQEAGVDEADLVETDGELIYAVSGGSVVISRAWPIEDAVELARVAVAGEPDGIYLHGDRLTVLSRLNEASIASRAGVAIDRRGPLTVITGVDIADPSAPVVVREIYAQGELDESRLIGDRLFVVTYTDVDVAEQADDLGEVKRAIRDADIDRWLPWRQDDRLVGGAWTSTAGEACGCDEVWASEREGGTFLTHVMSIDLADPDADVAGEAVVGQVDNIYASASSIWLATSEVEEGAFPTVDDELDTIVHKFDISEADAHPTYVATGRVEGVLTDRFAMSERDGVLRIATTEVDVWESRVETLAIEDGEIVHLDAATGIAPDEELKSVRFIGELGFLVTYPVEDAWDPDVPMTDPLFTVDLSDPSDVRVLGELEITGWSDYIHRMDDDHLLTVGVDDGGVEGWKLAVSLFDVSDLEQPALVDRVLLDAWSSEAQTDPHAFNWFAEASALALPSFRSDGTSALEVFHVTPDRLTWRGGITTEPLLADETAATDLSWCAPLRRSVILDDKVWAYAELGLVAATLEAPEEALSTVPFGTEACE